MAILTSSYRNTLVQYRRYVEAVRNRPVLQASLFVVLTLLLLIILVAFALRPTLLTIAGLYGNLGKQRGIALQLDQHIQAQAAAAQIYNQVQPQLSFLDAAIPSPPSIETWTSQLDLDATNSGVEVANITVAKIAIPKDISGSILKSDFFLLAKGDFSNLKSFLKLIESSRRLLIIDGVTLNKSATIDSHLQMQITGQILYSKQ